MRSALTAGLVYVAIVFAAGFLAGALRTVVLAPRIGTTWATIVELPVMLAVSWIACQWIIARFSVPERYDLRLLMGGLAFSLLMVAELGVSVFGFGRTFAAHLATYQSPASLIGLAAQLAFALFPLLQARQTAVSTT
jgi:hypothetical protein